jgi:hypothetical protein
MLNDIVNYRQSGDIEAFFREDSQLNGSKRTTDIRLLNKTDGGILLELCDVDLTKQAIQNQIEKQLPKRLNSGHQYPATHLAFNR